MAIQIESSLF